MKNIFLIIFFIALLFGITFTVLTNMGGNSETLKISVEQYIATALQGEASVGTLNDLQYFPQVVVDIEDTKVTRPEVTDPVFKMGSLQVAMDFWNISLGKLKLAVLNAKDIYAQAGVLTKKELSLSRLGIVDEKIDNPAFLFAKGKYGGRDFEGHMDLQRVGGDSPYQYMLSDTANILIESKPLTLKGTVIRDTKRKMEIKDINIRVPQTALRGDLVLQTSSNHENIYIEGKVTLGNNTILSPDLKLEIAGEMPVLTGVIHADMLDVQDVDSLTALLRELKNITGFKDVSKTPLSNMEWGNIQMDITLNAQEVKNVRGGNAAFITQITMENGKIDLGAVQDKIR